MSIVSFAQSDFDISKDAENGNIVFKGLISVDDLKKESSFTWLQSGIDGYTPNAKDIDYLETELPKYKLMVGMGTWCSDSHMLIPQLFKVLQLTQYPMQQFTMYGVDRAKTTKHDEAARYDFKRVPTIILYDGNTEMGRIVENASKSIEADLEAIIKQYQKGKK